MTKYPFRKCNLLGDVLVKKSIAVCNVKPKFLEQFDSPEHIFHQRLSLGAPEFWISRSAIAYVQNRLDLRVLDLGKCDVIYLLA